ncbi:hypothetical protein Ga0100231_021625 [Opitutaceae bacterium TAV4]|uniref:DUF2017 family protein n=1 Tax=Geminisphaera colitermitum TaxID=1148786 RepID=UPI0005BA6FF9|nr:hypothetical protein [Geminisphaera colitermitum]RRJ96459.1 hypothetical protein Ga0100231_021625 [Opitutaceae bacterium TAV4]RRJ99799.1 hypothetical protein Ga0100230_017245 [Opitutaceae bacterium TAV3]
MKRIEVKLSLTVVAPLLDVIKAASDTLQQELAAGLTLDDVDPLFRDDWREELQGEQREELRTLLALFNSEFFSTGIVAFDSDNAEVIAKACSAVRLRLRERFLDGLTDEDLEGGSIDPDTLDEPVRKAFMCYLFLATIQELIIQHLDTAILD